MGKEFDNKLLKKPKELYGICESHTTRYKAMDKWSNSITLYAPYTHG